MKKKKLINILIEVIYYLVFVGFLLVVKNCYSVPVDYDLTMFFIVALFFVGVMLLAGSHANKYLGLLFGFIYSLYLIAQRVYYRGFESYFRFSTAIELGKEVAGQKAAIGELAKVSDFIPMFVIFGITILFLIIRYVLKIKTKYKWYVRVSCVVCFVVSFLLYNGMIKKINATNADGNWQINKTDFYLYDTVNNPEAFVKKFGLLTYGFRDGQVTIVQNNNEADFESEIENYFSNKNSSLISNDYTGIFKDKNLLIIQAESLNNFAISEELTPCLYNLLNHSIEFTNFDTPLLVGSTSDSEFMTNTSFIPESEGYSVCYKYVDNKYPLTLGNLFNKNGFSTNAFHNNYAEYYNRNITFNNYGYNFMDCYLLGMESENPDTLMTEQIGWIDVEKEKFLSFWISYSGHQPYEIDSVAVNEENVNRVKEKYPNLNDDYVYYIAKIMDFDQSLQMFMNIFEWNGRTDDVCVMIYGDHIAKGLDFNPGSNFEEVFGGNNIDNAELIYTPCFIYAPGYEHEKVDKYCTCLDILPTVCNLWGIEYDKKYEFGNDILDPSYDGFCFDANGNYWNSNFQYDAQNGTINTSSGYSETKAQELVDKFNTKRNICNKILKIDYFANNK